MPKMKLHRAEFVTEVYFVAPEDASPSDLQTDGAKAIKDSLDYVSIRDIGVNITVPSVSMSVFDQWEPDSNVFGTNENLTLKDAFAFNGIDYDKDKKEFDAMVKALIGKHLTGKEAPADTQTDTHASPDAAHQ